MGVEGRQGHADVRAGDTVSSGLPWSSPGCGWQAGGGLPENPWAGRHYRPMCQMWKQLLWALGTSCDHRLSKRGPELRSGWGTFWPHHRGAQGSAAQPFLKELLHRTQDSIRLSASAVSPRDPGSQRNCPTESSRKPLVPGLTTEKRKRNQERGEGVPTLCLRLGGSFSFWGLG